MTMRETYATGYRQALHEIKVGYCVGKIGRVTQRLRGEKAAFCRGYVYALEDERLLAQVDACAILNQVAPGSWYVTYPQRRPEFPMPFRAYGNDSPFHVR